ncbi:MAG TPA: 2-amino-4-hydroxy-6-hydroxymethyldihydropteridine diphosphokinase [Candidatus Tyrphobacter sp.]
MSVVAYVGIGSNVGDAAGNVRRAIAALNDAGRVRGVSPLLRTRPWGRSAQPAFVNAVARIETLLAPQALLAALQRIEVRLGRRPSYHWGPRVIDLDLLLFDRLRLETPDLSIPHPRLAERPFMLLSLTEVLIPGSRPPAKRSRGVR